MICPDCDAPDPGKPGRGNGMCSQCHGKGRDSRGAVCESCGGSSRCLTCFGFGTVGESEGGKAP